LLQEFARCHYAHAKPLAGLKIADVVGYDEIASGDKSEFEHEFIVWVEELRP